VSYASEPGTPARSRPGTVTISSYLLYLIAALQVISSIISFAYLGEMQAVYEDAFSEVEGGDAAAGVTTAILVFASVFGLLVGVALVVLAVFNNRGKNPSRITTWVVGGIFLCCGGSGLAGQLGGGFNFGGAQDPDMPTAAELQQMLDDVLPSWFQPVTILLGVIGLLALLAALVLLALPPSNEFFRKRQPEWQPPGGGPGYQAYPAYPAYPPVPPTTSPGSDPSAAAGPDPSTPPGSDPSAPPNDRPGA